MVNGRDYDQSITVPGAVSPGDGAVDGSVNAWDWPDVANDAYAYGYPELAIGQVPWNPLPNTFDHFPIQVDDIVDLTLDFDLGWTPSGPQDDFNISVSLWLTDDPDGGFDAVQNEVMIWLRNSSHAPAGNGADTINGRHGNDTITGLGGNDSLLGMSGDDSLMGGTGADTLRGGWGDDVFHGRAGNDFMRGDGGADRFVFANGGGNDTVGMFDTDVDLIDLSAISGVNGHLRGFDLVQVGSTAEIRIDGTDQVISLNFTSVGNLSAEDFVF